MGNHYHLMVETADATLCRGMRQRWPEPKQAMAMAYRSGHYSLEEVGDYLGVSRMTVSRAVKASVKCET